MTLYEIDRELADLMDAVDPETGEWTGDTEAWERMSMAREKKIESTALFIKELRGDIAKFKAEIETLQKRLKTLQNKEAWLLDNLRRSLEGEPFATPRCQIRFRKNPESVLLTNETAAINWAKEYAPDILRYKPATLSLNDVKAELKKGTPVPGAELVRTVRMEVK